MATMAFILMCTGSGRDRAKSRIMLSHYVREEME